MLDSHERKRLRGKAHHLEPIVQVGHAGITDGVVAQTAKALADHELIKVRFHEPEDKRAMADQLAERTKSGLCGLVGHTVILYRPNPELAAAAAAKALPLRKSVQRPLGRARKRISKS